MTNMLLLAQGGFGIMHWIIIVIVIAACVGIMYVALNQFGIAIPNWVIQIFWICVVAL